MFPRLVFYPISRLVLAILLAVCSMHAFATAQSEPPAKPKLQRLVAVNSGGAMHVHVDEQGNRVTGCKVRHDMPVRAVRPFTLENRASKSDTDGGEQ